MSSASKVTQLSLSFNILKAANTITKIISKSQNIQSTITEHIKSLFIKICKTAFLQQRHKRQSYIWRAVRQTDYSSNAALQNMCNLILILQ